MSSRSGHRWTRQQRGRLGGRDHWVFYQRRNHSLWRSVVPYAGNITDGSTWPVKICLEMLFLESHTFYPQLYLDHSDCFSFCVKFSVHLRWMYFGVTQNKSHIQCKMAEPHWTLFSSVFNHHKTHSVLYNGDDIFFQIIQYSLLCE